MKRACLGLLALLGCQKPQPPALLDGAHRADDFLGTWKAADGTELLVTRTAIDRFDATRWLGRMPILEWTAEGPTVCDRGRFVEGSLTHTYGMLILKRGDRTVGLERHSDPAVSTRGQARILPEPPPAVSAELAAAIAAELARRIAADQAVRSGQGGDRRTIDAENRRWLEEQMAAVGWIDPERFGLQATQDATLLVQHSSDLALMMAVAPRIRGVEALRSEWVLMVDRLAVKLGEPQQFGTQARVLPDGGLAVSPITSPAQVSAARAAAGLEPWPVYLGGFEAGTTLPLLDCTQTPSETVPATPPP